MPVVVQHVGVGLADGVRDDLVAHEAAVHEEVLRVARGAREARRRDEAREPHARRRSASTSTADLREILAHDAARALPRRRRARGAPRAGRCATSEKATRGPRQRHARERLLAARELGGLALQELAPRRRVEVEVLHLDRGARRRAPRARPATARRRRRRCARHGARPRAGWRGRGATPRRSRRAPRRGSRASRRARGPRAWRSCWWRSARARAAGRRASMPAPSSATRMRRMPPSARSTETDCAPASRLFSTSSFSAEAGRSTTSPAAIWFTSSSGSARIWPIVESRADPVRAARGKIGLGIRANVTLNAEN